MSEVYNNITSNILRIE